MPQKPTTVITGLQLLTEDQRIALIVDAIKAKQTTGFVVEKDGKKGDRYLEKIRAKVDIMVEARLDFEGGAELIKITAAKPITNN